MNAVEHEVGYTTSVRGLAKIMLLSPRLLHGYDKDVAFRLPIIYLPQSQYFLPARRNASAGLCDSDVSVRPSVCLSVCHTPVLCLAERKQDREMYTI